MYVEKKNFFEWKLEEGKEILSFFPLYIHNIIWMLTCFLKYTFLLHLSL